MIKFTCKQIFYKIATKWKNLIIKEKILKININFTFKNNFYIISTNWKILIKMKKF